MNEELVSRVPLFASLPPAELEELAAMLRPRAVAEGTLLFLEGRSDDRLCILVEGEVEIIKALGREGERVLGVRGPVLVLGEMSLFSPESRHTASVRAHTALRVLEMSCADFDALLRRQPGLAYEMARTLSQRLEEFEDLTIQDLLEQNRKLTQAYEELKAAQAQLIRREELDRAKSRFVRLVTHELRSPLAAIQSLLDVTLEGYAGAVNGKGRELIGRAQHRIAFLLKLVEDLLELAAGHMENLEREREQVDLQFLCGRVVDLLQARATEKGVALRLEVAPGSYLLWGVGERLEGLLTNLTGNAVKYTPPGGHVQVRLRREGDAIVFSVADTGIGIPEEALPHLFEEFYRAPNARAQEREGTGLGLAIAQQAAQEHGGRIEVESKLGEGTVFTATLQALP